jgi:flagellar hook-basal body complex protein FliE
MVDMNVNMSGISNSMKGIWESRATLPKNTADLSSMQKAGDSDDKKANFADAVKGYVSKVDDLQQTSNMSIKDLLSGKNEDINSVVSQVAKADISFKLLVGVRNKLIEAYKQTMNMPL